MSEKTFEEKRERNILEVSLLHQTMVFFEALARWPASAVVLLLAVVAVFAGGVWRLLGAPATMVWAVALILASFFWVDGLIFWVLPRIRISFGPWQAQTVVLALPRSAVALILGVAGAWLSWQIGLILLLVAQATGVLLLLWGAVIEPMRLTMTRVTVKTKALSPGAAPIRLLHVSDLHVERLTRREEKLLALVADAHPDLIVITGDYLNLSYNEDETSHEQLKNLLRKFTAPHGVYATLGSPPVDLRHVLPPLLEPLALDVLRDAWTEVDLTEGRKLVLLGLDCTHHLEEDAERLAHLVTTSPNTVPRILLYHSPELMPQAAAHGVSLYLCGHTHGGQVRLPLVGPVITSSQLGRRFVMGHYRLGATHLYVSRGVGMEGLSAPRVRFLSPPEITLFTLQAEADSSDR